MKDPNTNLLQTARQHHQAGRVEQAEALYRQLLATQPTHATALYHLGVLLHGSGRNHDAAAVFQRLVEMAPHDSKRHSNLAAALAECGRVDAAIQHLRMALALQPNSAAAHNNLGVVLERGGRLQEAEAAYREAIRLQPDFAQAHNHLANTLRKRGRIREALSHHARALQLQPNYAEAHGNLATSLEELGCTEEALTWRRRLVMLCPQDSAAHSNLLYLLHCSDRVDPASLFAEHLAWARRYAQPLYPSDRQHDGHDRDPDRVLRVGYVSPDFREHAVARFIAPVLRGHNPRSVRSICYSDVVRADEQTRRLRSLAGEWRDVAHLRDQQLAEQVRQDRVDILVDLAGHTARNRLLLFARKPAPLQVTYLGYPDTTGLATMDCRITDDAADPVGSADSFHVERVVRLSQCAWCYEPGEDSPPVSDLPASCSGHITFGSLNRLAKVSDTTLDLWARVLSAVPGSKLLALAAAEEALDELRHRLHERGIDRGRIEGVCRVPRRWQYLELCHRIDVALDAFPYNGTTTTCDLLWMGVPVISLSGCRHVSRVGLSLLSAVGLHGLAAPTPPAYGEAAAQLASDWSYLAQLRSSLRQRMQSSPLMNARLLTENLERAYREMWAHWCRTRFR